LNVSLAFSIGPLDYPILNGLTSMLMNGLKDDLKIRSLMLRFTGPEMWISRNKNPFPRLPNLMKLLVADVGTCLPPGTSHGPTSSSTQR
jgi:hypothetical protein